MNRARKDERGAALLLALLLVALLAASAAASLWKQWSDAQVEAAERERAQAAWILTGALDWARFTLREDVDRRGETWAIPFDQAPLSAFLAADAVSGLADEAARPGHALLSGQITDLQSRLNVSNIAALGRISEPALRSFTRLFGVLGLPEPELARLAENLRRASDIGPDNALAGAAPPAPQRLEDLAALGLRPATIAALEPHATVLPGRSAVNLNTASAQVLYSAIDGMAMADAWRLVAARANAPFHSLAEAAQLLDATQSLAAGDFCVASRLFEVRARVRLGQALAQESSIVQRDSQEVVVLWRGRPSLLRSLAS